jgi:lysophospholipase L1-like esterase
MRVLVFGDSITQGYWDINGGWVNKLRKHYDELQIQDLNGRDEPTIFNLGVSADTSSDILSRIESETIARTRHDNLPIIIVQIGINDSCITQNKELVPLDEYRKNLKAIINKVKPISSKIIFVGLSSCDETLTTPVAWGDFHYTNSAIKNYEQAMHEVAAKEGVSFIPIFDKFIEKFEEGIKLLPDGLHPNREGHELIFKIVIPVLTTLLA